MQRKVVNAVLLALLCALAVPGTLMAQNRGCPDPGQTLVQGQVMCDQRTPKVDCEVKLSVFHGNHLVQEVVVRTDDHGYYSGCVECPRVPKAYWRLEVSTCCGSSWHSKLDGCPREIQVPPLMCKDCTPPKPARPCGPDQMLAVGYVICDNGEPMVGCEIEIIVKNPLDPRFEKRIPARTDHCGMYRVCVPCRPVDTRLEVYVHALCCKANLGPLPFPGGCPPVWPLPGLVCHNCSEPRPCQGVEVVGRVECEDRSPMARCDVAINVISPTLPPVPQPIIVTTDADGWYKACVPCPPNLPGSMLEIVALCCGSSTLMPFDGCPPTLGPPPIICPCHTTPGCQPGETLLKGHVYCANDPTNPGQPSPGCPVHIELYDPNTPHPIFMGDTVTERDGSYSLCVPCFPGGARVVVTPLCCGQPSEFFLKDCPAEAILPDITCDCGTIPQPCPTDFTLLTGFVLCDNSDPSHPPQPMPDCPIRIEVVCVDTGVPLLTADLITGPDGSYSICTPCCKAGVNVVVRAGCCGVTMTQDLPHCLPEFQMQDILCDCGQPPPRPCPSPDETLIQGEVFCFGTDPTTLNPVVRGEVTLTSDGCGHSTTYTTYTDHNGHYEQCVSCQNCPQLNVQVVATGCADKPMMDVGVAGCPPDVPVPPLHCSKCP